MNFQEKFEMDKLAAKVAFLQAETGYYKDLLKTANERLVREKEAVQTLTKECKRVVSELVESNKEQQRLAEISHYQEREIESLRENNHLLGVDELRKLPSKLIETKVELKSTKDMLKECQVQLESLQNHAARTLKELEQTKKLLENAHKGQEYLQNAHSRHVETIKRLEEALKTIKTTAEEAV